jgi:excisionase family DNA binding protein
MTDTTMTTAEVAKFLGVHVRTVYTYIRRGRLERVPGTNRTARITRDSVERYAAERGQRARKSLEELSERQQYRRRTKNDGATGE